MNTKEAAEFLGVSTSRIVKMIKAGKLPAEKILGQWKIKKTDLKKIMIRGRGIREYSVRIFFRKFKRGEKGRAPFLEAIRPLRARWCSIPEWLGIPRRLRIRRTAGRF